MKTFLNLGNAYRDSIGALRVDLQLCRRDREGSIVAICAAEYVNGARHHLNASAGCLTANARTDFLRAAVECASPSAVKSVGWAYPTSPNAEAFGVPSVGCWTVALGEPGRPLHAVRSFAVESAAIDYAKALPWGWDSSYLKIHPEINA